MTLERGFGLIQDIIKNLSAQGITLAQMRDELAQPNRDGLLTTLNQLVCDGSPLPLPSAEMYPFNSQGTQIFYKGVPFFAVLVNMRELAHYDRNIVKYISPEETIIQTRGAELMGAKVVRFFAPHLSLSDDEITRRVEKTLNALHERKMFGVVALTDGAQSGFRIADTLENHNGSMYTHNFFRTGYQGNYMRLLRFMVSRLAGHPGLFAWELGNEFHTPFPPAPTLTQCENIYQFCMTTARELKNLDPKTMRLPGFISCWELYVENAYGGARYAEKTYAGDELSAITWHTYQDELVPYELLGTTRMNINGEINIRKPALVEELNSLHTWESPTWIENLIKFLYPRVSLFGQWNISYFYNQDRGVGDGLAYLENGADQGRRWNKHYGLYRAKANEWGAYNF